MGRSDRIGTAGDCLPSALNIPGAPYPCIYPDHRVTFRIAAPDAQKVRVRIGQGFDMTKAADGLWYVTTTPQVVGFHYYTLSVDGAVVADPATRTYFGSGFYNSAIEVPEPAADAEYASVKNVPHGAVRQQRYFSTVTGAWRRAYVYTPPDYDSAKGKLLFLGIGSAEGPGTKTFSEQLTQAGIKNVYYESPGTAHEWLTWRRCFKEFAPLLFR